MKLVNPLHLIVFLVYFFSENSKAQMKDNHTLSVEISLNAAHQYSQNYRYDAGYCPTSKNLLNIEGEGFLEISLANAEDIVSSMKEIIKLTDADPNSKKPSKFRLIYGNKSIGSNSSDLMLVGIYDDEKGKHEIINVVVNGNDMSAIRKLDNIIDCPIKCDYAGSEIILGEHVNADDACPSIVKSTTKKVIGSKKHNIRKTTRKK
jgi:hypothetical protein